MKQQGFFEDETGQKLQSIKHGTAAMLVALRVRPLTSKEVSINPNECLKPIDSKLVALVDPGEENQRKKVKQTQFAFDFVFAKDSATKKIYDECLSVFLGGVLQGFNTTILAYGATGCGKTYTMIGQANSEGLCALALIDLLGRAQQLKYTHHVILRLSYIEIYNETIKDLLVSEDKALQLRQDPKEGVHAHGATEVPVGSLLELGTLLKVGAANRSKESTGSNEASSRSHALLLVKAETREKAHGIKEELHIGKLSLVDLAGSERAVGGKFSRQLQGAKINKSLLALGNCIQILSQGGGKGHIPYRQSKLTRLLKEALGGNCRTAMLACVSPFAGSREQTYNTLLYASRARNIDGSVTRNVQNSEAHLSNYVSLIGNLKRQNEDLKRQLKGNKNHSLPQLKIANSGLQLEIDRLSGKIDSHFSKESMLLKAIHEVTMKVDRTAFQLIKVQLERKKTNVPRPVRNRKTDKQQQNLNNNIQELGEQKQGLEKRLQQLFLSRGALVEQIKNGQWSTHEANGLFVHYREKKIETELEEVRLREARIISEKGEKDGLLYLVGEELKARERIIEEQKIIIQKNNIINRITYSRLNNSQVIPAIEQRYALSVKPTIPRELSEEYSRISAQKSRVVETKENKKIKGTKRDILDSNRSDFSYDKVKEKQTSPKSLKKPKKKQLNSIKKKSQPFDLVYLQR